jgi:hypothetical protein
VKVSDARRWRKANGFVKLPRRGAGDHERFERPDGTRVGLDGRAREVSRHIERTIAHALGISQREFRTAVSEGRTLLRSGCPTLAPSEFDHRTDQLTYAPPTCGT